MKINVNGIEMYYEKCGQGRPLVLVHGNGVDHNEFQNSMWLLRRHFTVYAMHGKMNLPSCGKEYFLQPVSRFFFVR